jgi:hypothetical protein
MMEVSSLLAWIQAATAVVAIVVAVAAIFAAIRIPVAQHKIERKVAEAQGDRIAKFLALAVQIELREVNAQLPRVAAHVAGAMPLSAAGPRDATVTWLEAARIETAPTLAEQVDEFWRLGSDAAGLVQLVGRLQQYNRIIDRSVALASYDTVPSQAVAALSGHLNAIVARMPAAQKLLSQWVSWPEEAAPPT